jgi:hypothetical protein
MKWIFKSRDKQIENLRKEIIILQKEIEDKEYFYEIGRRAAQFCLNGYVMIDKSYLPKGKNCPLFMGHGVQLAADKLGVHDKKYARAFKHEGRIFMNKLRWEYRKDQ